jgi:hypothetical protein
MAKQKQENKQITKQSVKVNVNVLTKKKKKTKGRRKAKKTVDQPIMLPQMPQISYSYSPGYNPQTTAQIPSQPIRENPEPSSLNNILNSGNVSALSNLAFAYANNQNRGQVDAPRARGNRSSNRSMFVGEARGGGGQNISSEEEKEFSQVKSL